MKKKYLVCVDNTEHSKVAVKYACSKARQIDGAVELIHIIDSSEYNNNTLFGVSDRIRDERRKEAEQLMVDMASEAQRFAVITPSCIIREGVVSEEVVKVVTKDGGFCKLIIGKAPHEAKKNDMISMLTSELASKLMIPITIVPGNLSDQEVGELA